mmetsp:Transcript_7250/g.20449  ORF Transcript_7250/g.20449 Transcript_7250/m.20449 type:complete len:258 (-) Transcript_7250:4220-4993(-)
MDGATLSAGHFAYEHGNVSARLRHVIWPHVINEHRRDQRAAHARPPIPTGTERATHRLLGTVDEVVVRVGRVDVPVVPRFRHGGIVLHPQLEAVELAKPQDVLHSDVRLQSHGGGAGRDPWQPEGGLTAVVGGVVHLLQVLGQADGAEQIPHGRDHPDEPSALYLRLWPEEHSHIQRLTRQHWSEVGGLAERVADATEHSNVCLVELIVHICHKRVFLGLLLLGGVSPFARHLDLPQICRVASLQRVRGIVRHDPDN